MTKGHPSPHYRQAPAENPGRKGPATRAQEYHGKTVRINKALADAGVCSRRRADELIAAGRVSVNGEPVASPGLQVTPGTDKLEVDGKPVQPIAQAPCYLLLNKPVRVVSTAYDPEAGPRCSIRPREVEGPPPLSRRASRHFFRKGLSCSPTTVT